MCIRDRPKAFNDPIRGKELTLSQVSRGADIVFHASGKSGSGVFGAAKEKEIWAIGIDSDQHDEAPCCVLTSMVKNVDVAVYEAIGQLVDGAFKSGVQEFGLAESGVGYIYEPKNEARITKDIRTRLDGLTEKIVTGEIEVPWK